MKGRVTDADLAKIHHLLAISKGDGTMLEAREVSGLSLGQTVRVTGIPRERLLALEAGTEGTPAELDALRTAYGVLGFVESVRSSVPP